MNTIRACGNGGAGLREPLNPQEGLREGERRSDPSNADADVSCLEKSVSVLVGAREGAELCILIQIAEKK